MSQFNLISLVTAIFGFAFALIMASTRSRLSWLALGLTAFLSAIGIAVDYRKQLWEQWMLPVQIGRPFELAMTCAGMLLGARITSFVPAYRASLALYLPIALGVALGVVRLIHGQPEDALVSVFFALLTGSAAVAFARQITYATGEARWFAKSLAVVGIALMACSFVQYVVNPSRLVIGLNSRFISVCGNPQFAGVAFAMSGVSFLWLSRGASIGRKILLLCATVVSVGLVVWTGSRTSLVMLALGAVICSVRRLGALVALLPLAVLLFFAVQFLADALGVELPLSRLFSVENTRSEAWSRLLDSFMRDPVFGVGGSELDASENSFLYAAASYGLIGVISLVIAVSGTLAVSFRAWRESYSQPPHLADSIDYGLALVAMLLFGALFEGYLVARLSIMTLIWMVSVTVLDAIPKVAAQRESEEVEVFD